MATIYEIRRDNLRALIRERGNAEVAAAAGYASASYLSQMAGKSPTRTVTEQTARHIEEKLALPEYWLDIERDAYGKPLGDGKRRVPLEAPPPMVTVDPEEIHLVAACISNAMVTQGVKLPKEKFSAIAKMMMSSNDRTEAGLQELADQLVSLVR